MPPIRPGRRVPVRQLPRALDTAPGDKRPASERGSVTRSTPPAKPSLEMTSTSPGKGLMVMTYFCPRTGNGAHLAKQTVCHTILSPTWALAVSITRQTKALGSGLWVEIWAARQRPPCRSGLPHSSVTNWLCLFPCIQCIPWLKLPAFSLCSMRSLRLNGNVFICGYGALPSFAPSR